MTIQEGLMQCHEILKTGMGGRDRDSKHKKGATHCCWFEEEAHAKKARRVLGSREEIPGQ